VVFVAHFQYGRILGGASRKDALLSPHRNPHTHASIANLKGGTLLAEIQVFIGESIENAMRRFKRQVQQEGIIKEIKKHAFYMKPGEKKRLKSKLAQKFKRKKARRIPPDTEFKGQRSHS
jgi:small subunit ribosomal protein S21